MVDTTDPWAGNASLATTFTGVGGKESGALKYQFHGSKIYDATLNIEVYNSQGLELKESNSFNTERVKLALLSDYTKDAFISIEDKKFYEHSGVNLQRIFKAFLNNLKSFEVKEGASTITQQLIKNTHLSNEKTLTRKRTARKKTTRRKTRKKRIS